MRASINRPPTPDADEERVQKPTLQEVIHIKLIESGEKERLKELLRERLIECGWRDEMHALCRAFARKKGRQNVTVDELVHVITPKGRYVLSSFELKYALENPGPTSVPDAIKAELLQRIRTFLMNVHVD